MNLEKLKKIFKVDNFLQLFMVFLVFGITGSLALVLSDIILFFFNVIKEEMNFLFYFLMRVLVMFIVYQVLLILVATIFGEFKYFWEFEKKFLKRIGLKIK